MTIGVLPSFLKLKSPEDLIRLGKKNDGGYLVSKSDIYQTNFLISFGINDDWSFESDFTNLRNMPLLAYDASVNLKFFIKITIISIFNLKNFSNIFHGPYKIIKYFLFFRGDKKHIKKYVGINSPENYISLKNILNSVASDSIFLKVDIEGSEYRLLTTIIDYQERLTGLVIEFHDCDLHIEKIKFFIEHFKLRLVHVHANNYAPIIPESGLPTVLEMTFSKFSQSNNYIDLPHKLDMPNDRLSEEIRITFD